MKKLFTTLITAAGLMSLSAQVYTTPVGYNVVTCLGGSDTHVSVPFHQKPIYQGGASNSGATVTLDSAISQTLSTNPDGEGTHYLRVISGIDAGKYFNITAGAGTNIIIDLAVGESLTIGAADTVKIIEHWTLDALFPPDTQDPKDTATPTSPLYQSASDFGLIRGSEVLLPDRSTLGINKAPSSKHFVKPSSNGGWVNSSNNNASSGHQIIDPDSGLIIRHPAGAQNTSFIPKGVVETGIANASIVVSTVDVDNPISIERPISIQLQDLNAELVDPVFVPSASTFGLVRKDELLVYENGTTYINKAPSRKYYRLTNGDWIKDGNVANTDTIDPSSYIVIRKKAVTTNGVIEFSNSPTY